MKLPKLFAFVLFAALSTSGLADNHHVENDGYNVMLDMVLRPVSLAGTVIGAGLFVGLSPLTALASIPQPHDAFEKLADTIVCKPAKYTFVRPVGDYRYDEGCRHPVPAPVAQIVPAAAPAPVVSEPAPEYQPPQDTNQKIDAMFKKEMMK